MDEHERDRQTDRDIWKQLCLRWSIWRLSAAWFAAQTHPWISSNGLGFYYKESSFPLPLFFDQQRITVSPSAWLAVSFPHTGLWKITSVSSITAAIKSAVHLRACERVAKTHPMQKTCCLSLSLQSEPERADASLGFDSPLGLSDWLYSEHLSAVSGCVSLRSP